MDATVVVGIDVSKNRLDVHVRPAGDAFFVRRDGDGIAALVDRLIALAPAAVAVEATGGFEAVVAAGLAAAGLPVVVVNPAQVRAFANALGKRAKTDPIDAVDWSVIRVCISFETSNATSTLPPLKPTCLTDPTSTPATRTGAPVFSPATLSKRAFSR